MGTLVMVLAKRTAFAILITALTSSFAVAQLSSWKVPLALTERTSDMSQHELGQLRLTKDKDGDAALTFSFKTKSQVKLMGEYVVLRLGNTSVGEPLIQPLFAARNNVYSQKLDKETAEIVQKFGAEIYVAGEFQSTFFLLSNTIMFGPAQSQVTTSPITNAMREKIAIQLKNNKDAGPQYDTVPPNFTLLTKARTAWPGMAVRYYADGVWTAAEYLGKDENSRAVVRKDPYSRTVTVVERFNVAIDDKEFATTGATRQAPKPSLELMPDSSVIVPEGFMLNEFLRTLYPGVPVRVFVKGEFYDGFVTKVDGYAITVSGSRIPKGEFIANFYSVIMTPEVHKLLSKLWRAEAVEHFGKYLSPDNKLTPLQAAGRPDLEAELVAKEAIEAEKEALEAEMKAMEAKSDASEKHDETAKFKISEMTTIPKAELPRGNKNSKNSDERPVVERKLKNYPIKMALPAKASVVMNSLPLEPGIKLGCNWGARWYWVTVVDVYSDSAVRIHWNDFGAAWDCDVARSDLIVDDQLKRKLERKVESAEVMPRLWKDASEKFKVLAYFESATEESVRLVKTDGKLLNLPLGKLSQKDQEIILRKIETAP